jgi:deoxyuridine 5'-triphosphate nucleotidohydrolase
MPHSTVEMNLDLMLEMPPELWCQIAIRSSIARKGVIVLAGVIDSDYRGPLIALLHNLTAEPVHFQAGDRIVQLIFHHRTQVKFNLTSVLTTTVRGTGGFGSTDSQPVNPHSQSPILPTLDSHPSSSTLPEINSPIRSPSPDGTQEGPGQVMDLPYDTPAAGEIDIDAVFNQLVEEITPNVTLYPLENKYFWLRLPVKSTDDIRRSHFNSTWSPTAVRDLAQELALPKHQRRQPIYDHLADLRIRALLRQKRQGDGRTYTALTHYSDETHWHRHDENNPKHLVIGPEPEYIDVIE